MESIYLSAFFYASTESDKFFFLGEGWAVIASYKRALKAKLSCFCPYTRAFVFVVDPIKYNLAVLWTRSTWRNSVLIGVKKLTSLPQLVSKVTTDKKGQWTQEEDVELVHGTERRGFHYFAKKLRKWQTNISRPGETLKALQVSLGQEGAIGKTRDSTTRYSPLSQTQTDELV